MPVANVYVNRQRTLRILLVRSQEFCAGRRPLVKGSPPGSCSRSLGKLSSAEWAAHVDFTHKQNSVSAVLMKLKERVLTARKRPIWSNPNSRFRNLAERRQRAAEDSNLRESTLSAQGNQSIT